MIARLAYYPGSGHTQIRALLRSAFGIEIGDDTSPSSLWVDLNETPTPDPKFASDRPKWPLDYSDAIPDDDQKTIYVVEHPYSAIQAVYEREALDTAQEGGSRGIILGAHMYGSWGAHVQAWNPLKRKNTLTIRLEDIVTTPDQVIQAIAEFLELPIKLPKANSKRSKATTSSSALSETDLNLISFLFRDQMKRFDYQHAARINRSRALTAILEFSRHASPVSTSETNIRNSEPMIQDLKDREKTHLDHISDLSTKLTAAKRKVGDLERRNEALLFQNAQKADYLKLAAHALEPRWKTILTLRPLRFIFNQRNQIKNGTLSLDPSGLPMQNPLVPDQASSNKQTHKARASVERPTATVAAPSIYASYNARQPLGIAVFAYDRGENVENVLESLALQSALDQTHVWIDGDQGNPDKKKRLDETTARISRFAVKHVHRNRGNFGFRKMMIVAMRKMFEQYERVLFLEDDCFPTRYAVQGFSHELDLIEQNPEIMSVYGHPFLVPGEQEGGIGRFQGWGWASTRDKLMPLWPTLLDTYLMSEDEYRTFVADNLTQEILDHIDVTPGRQPSSTLPKFFAWDEVLGFLAALNGMSHKATTERLIYNFGVGATSTHFGKIDHYRAPPFNMVTIDEIWQQF